LTGLHEGQPVLATGEPLASATAALVLVHGRGSSATNILQLGAEASVPGLALLAPQAAGGSWYPLGFMEPIKSNEPWLHSALGVLAGLLEQVEKTIPITSVGLLGFSQGACLTLEFTARNARRYGGIVGISGGLIGPDGTPRDYQGSLAGTPVFLGCSDVDPHIPLSRVMHTAEVLRSLGGDVSVQIYPGLGHEVNADEIRVVRRMVAALPRRDSVGEAAAG
jgi:predicted esterase